MPIVFIFFISFSGTLSVTVTLIDWLWPYLKIPLAYSNCAIEPPEAWKPEAIPTIVRTLLNMFLRNPRWAWPSFTSIYSSTSSAVTLPKQLDSAQVSFITQYRAILSVGREPSKVESKGSEKLKISKFEGQNPSAHQYRLTWTNTGHLSSLT